MKSIPLFSVLIPAYNAENTIVRCIESILQQGSYPYEVIVINDGSTDGTYNILKKYADIEQFKVINQENHGVSYTRQQLIKNATGKYILFCDADDYLESNALKIIGEFIGRYDNFTSERIDLFVFGYNLVRESGKKRIQSRVLKNGLYSRNQYSRRHVAGFNDLYYSALWNKCFRRELIFSPNEIIFENLIEDVMFNIDYIGRCNRIMISDNIIYNYNQIGESLTRSNKSDSPIDILDALDAYVLLKNKACKTYPDHSVSINKDIYYRLYLLKRRSRDIQFDGGEISIQNYMRDCKRQLGKHYMIVKAIIFINSIKRNIRKIVKN